MHSLGIDHQLMTNYRESLVSTIGGVVGNISIYMTEMKRNSKKNLESMSHA